MQRRLAQLPKLLKQHQQNNLSPFWDIDFLKKSPPSLLLAPLATFLLSSTLNAAECVNIKNVNVGWTSYKTLAKIGVSGTFDNVKLTKSKDTANLKSALEGTSVLLNISNIDAKAAIKTKNILTYFAPKLTNGAINAKIVKVGEKGLTLAITLNGKKQLIPMKYTVNGGVVSANGVIDARDFGIENALKNLNKNVPAHKNKGWLDIAINFKLTYTNKCK